MVGGLLLACVLLAVGATTVLPIIGPIRDARPGAQVAAGVFASLGIALLTLALFVPFFVLSTVDLLAGIVVLGLYGFVADLICIAIAAVIARAGKPRAA